MGEDGLKLDMKTREVRERVVDTFFKNTGRSYDRVVAITSLGLDAHWKRRLIKHVPRDAKRILDLACGTGIVLERLHRKAPDAALVGVDITDEYLAVARHKFAEREDVNLELIHSNAETMELSGQFDVVTSCYIPKYVDPDILLERLKPHLAPGAIVALHDFDHPRGFPRLIWNAYMWLLGKIGPKIFPEWRVVFDENLAELIALSKWVRRYREAFKRHGFEEVAQDKLFFRTASIVHGRWPDDGAAAS